MKELYDKVSVECSKQTTLAYSTSFSLGVRMLNKCYRHHIYSLYGFVRFADEIVDTFHDYNKAELIQRYRRDVEFAVAERISINPILNSFQHCYHQNNFEWSLVDCFLKSMEMDLEKSSHSIVTFNEYVLGSAEVVGLMCLKVFTNGNIEMYEKLKPFAMKLGSAFQKVNFLRDVQEDYNLRGRTYFPGLNWAEFTDAEKRKIESEIEDDFREALIGIKKLPREVRFGVYLAYVYYRRLFQKIRSVPSHQIMKERIRIPDRRKLALIVSSYVRHNLNII
ncbi:MAG: phytoene/squalene synthase family protein [Flavobacteriales bacterium]|nr:phytoene/squalene synthase family protein [Flavobacteriales bacterium]